MCIVRKILIAISLFAVIPFLVTFYVITNASGSIFTTKGIIIFITCSIGALGAIILFKLSRTLVKLYKSLSIIAKGDFNHKVEIEKSSGIGDMAISINDVSHRLRESADELEMRAILIKRFNQELGKTSRRNVTSLPNIVHELRAPLINIDKSSALLLERGDNINSSDQGSFLKIINDNAKRLIHLTSNLLDLSKMQSTGFMMDYKLLSVEEVITDAINSVDSWRQSRNLRLETKISEDIPRVYADRERMIQVIVNLLSNAIKFTPPAGEIIVEAKVFEDDKEIIPPSTKEDNERLIQISVRDTGAGIPASQKDKIFDRFSASANTLDIVPSTGLGLPIVKQIIQMHGGRIWVESQPGKGTKITFIIPEGLKKGTKDAESITHTLSKRILIIDDEGAVRELLNRELNKKGYSVTTAQDGVEGLKKMLESSYDLVITDIRMPYINGIDFIKMLKKIDPGLSFIVITGFPVEQDLEEMLKGGGYPCIRKPFDLPDLLNTVERPVSVSG